MAQRILASFAGSINLATNRYPTHNGLNFKDNNGAGVQTSPQDGDYITIGNHAMELSGDLGTTGTGNGIRRVSFSNAGASLTIDGAAQRHIYWADTGVSGIGTGTAVAPGTDADYHGFYLGRTDTTGLSLVGTASAPVVIEPADIAGGGAWYIAKVNGGLGFNSTPFPPITLQYCAIKRLGKSAGTWANINLAQANSGTSMGAVNIQHCSFQDCNQILNQVSSANSTVTAMIESFTFSYNTITGTIASQTLVFVAASNGTRNVTIEYNTESARVGSSTNSVLCLASGGLVGASFRGNVVQGIAARPLGILRMIGASAAVPCLVTAVDNMSLSHFTGAFSSDLFQISGSWSTIVCTGNHSEECDRVLALNAAAISAGVAAPTITGNFGTQNAGAANAQGVLFISRSTTGWESSYNVNVLLAPGSNSFGKFHFSSSCINHLSHHETIVGLGGFASNPKGLYLGEASTTANASLGNMAHSCLVVGFSRGFFADGLVTFGTDVTGWTLHHNATFGNSTNYDQTGVTSVGAGSRWDDGTNLHPSATYSDLNGVNPLFVDTSRRAASWDAANGGPGTDNNLIARFATRCGITALFGAVDAITVAPIVAWVRDGFRPQAAAYGGAGYLGTDIGAIPLATGGALTVGTLNAAANVTATGADLTWTAATGGTAPISYQAQVSTNGGASWTNNGSATTTLAVSLTGLTAGTAYSARIVATDAASGSVTYTAVSFTTLSTVTGVTVLPSSVSVGISSTVQLVAPVAGAGSPSQSVTWGTSNGAVATVSGTGLVTGVAVGTATITATSVQDNTKSGTSAVTVTLAPPVTAGATDRRRRRALVA